MPYLLLQLADFLALEVERETEIRSLGSSPCGEGSQLCGNCDYVLSGCATMAKVLMALDTTMTFRVHLWTMI